MAKENKEGASRKGGPSIIEEPILDARRETKQMMLMRLNNTIKSNSRKLTPHVIELELDAQDFLKIKGLPIYLRSHEGELIRAEFGDRAYTKMEFVGDQSAKEIHPIDIERLSRFIDNQCTPEKSDENIMKIICKNLEFVANEGVKILGEYKNLPVQIAVDAQNELKRGDLQADSKEHAWIGLFAREGQVNEMNVIVDLKKGGEQVSFKIVDIQGGEERAEIDLPELFQEVARQREMDSPSAELGQTQSAEQVSSKGQSRKV